MMAGFMKAPVYSKVSSCHSHENGNPGAVPANAGNQRHIKLDSCFHRKPWIPAFAGMTSGGNEYLLQFQPINPQCILCGRLSDLIKRDLLDLCHFLCCVSNITWFIPLPPEGLGS